MPIIAAILSVLLVSVIFAKDTEHVYETQDCVSYEKTVRNFWWSSKPGYTIDYIFCGAEKDGWLNAHRDEEDV